MVRTIIDDLYNLRDFNAFLISFRAFAFSISGTDAKITADYIKLKYPCGKDIIESLKQDDCNVYGSGFAIKILPIKIYPPLTFV